VQLKIYRFVKQTMQKPLLHGIALISLSFGFAQGNKSELELFIGKWIKE
jgi:hypothetical protein